MVDSSKTAKELKALRNRARLSVRTVASAIGMPASSYAYFEDDFKKRFLPAELVHKLLPVFGAEGIPASDLLRLSGQVAGGSGAALGEPRLVPVIDYAQAGAWREICDAFQPGDGMDFIAVEPGVAGPHAFALEIVGNSMEPEFVEGDRVLMDPDVKPLPGNYVVARRAGEGESTFKKFRSRGTDRKGRPIIELVPINEDWPTLTIDAEHPGEIIATMLEHRARRLSTRRRRG